MFKDESGEIVPAIVSEELWKAANAVLQRRSEDMKNRQGICNHANLLTGKLFCTHCGTPYYRRESRDKAGNKNSKWVCSGKINNGKDSCDSIPLYESELIPVIFEVFRETRDISAAMIEEYGRMYTAMISDGNLTKNIAGAEGKIELTRMKKAKLLELVALGSITNSEFKEDNDACNAEIKALEEELMELRAQQESGEEFRTHMEKIKAVLVAAEGDVASGTVTKEFIDTFIDKIFVTPEGNKTVRLDIRIFTGDTTAKYLQKLKSRGGIITTPTDRTEENADAATGSATDGRTGHMFKSICPIPERSHLKSGKRSSAIR